VRTFLARWNTDRDERWAAFGAVEQAATVERAGETPKFGTTALMVCEVPWVSTDPAPPNTPTLRGTTTVLRMVAGRGDSRPPR
jgi:hypothetical protein